MAAVKALMIGDVVGTGGLEILESLLPGIVAGTAADFVVVNGENAADGFGMTEQTMRRIFAAGADCITSGNHVWEKRDFWPAMEAEPRLLRPANYPPGTPGRGVYRVRKAGLEWAVISLQGREMMTPIDCPFRTLESIINGFAAESGGGDSPGPAPVILVDFHAESTREKEALGYFADGRVSLVAGTHTHVQTADGRVLPSGSGYITDLGMTGVANAVIGMDSTICVDRARTQVLYRMEPARPGPGRPAVVMGVLAEIDGESRRAVSVKPVMRQ